MTTTIAGEATRAARRRLPLVGLLAAQLISRAGNAITMIAVPLYVLGTTHSPLATGIAGVFATLPVVIGGSLGGVLVDRFGYRISSIAADLASGVTVLAIPVLALTVGLPFWGLVLLVFLSGLLDTPGDTAKAVIVPELAALARTPLSRAAGAQAAIERTASMVGAAVAGALVALVGPLSVLFVDAASFLACAVLVAVTVPRRLPASAAAPAVEPSAGGYWAGLAAGLRFVWRSRLLRGVILLVTMTNAIDAAGMTVLKPVYATATGDPALLGLIVGCFAVGALTGSILFAGVGRRWSGRGMFVACFFLAGVPPYAAMALAVPVPALLVVLALSGLAAGALNPMIATVMYGLVPDGMRARVFGVTSAGATAAMPLGAFLAGITVAAFGLHAVLIGCAVLYGCLTVAPLFDRAFLGLAAARDDVPSDEERVTMAA
ncbi:MAG: MFS transporter [Leifsonia sp.]